MMMMMMMSYICTCKSLHVSVPVTWFILQQQLVVQREAVGATRSSAALLAATTRTASEIHMRIVSNYFFVDWRKQLTPQEQIFIDEVLVRREYVFRVT